MAWITLDSAVRGALDVAVPLAGLPAQVQGDGATTGRGVTVAVLDSGISPHPDNEGRVVERVAPGSLKKAWMDEWGHGTHVAGIIAGSGVNSGGLYRGVAPEADLVSVRLLDEDGMGRTSDVIAGIDWTIDHRQEYGIRLRQPFATAHPYPKATPALSRFDSWPPEGGPPGSSLAFMRAQHLDPHDIAFGMLQPLAVRGMDERVPGFAEAVSRAVNEWMREEWTAKEPRLKAPIAIPGEDAAASVREIERWAGHPDFVQVAMVTRALEPLGRQR